MEYDHNLARRMKDEAYQRRSSKAPLYSHVKGDSPEVREEKKRIREEIWRGYDKELTEIEVNASFLHAVSIGSVFFTEIENDSDVIGWKWRMSSNPCDDDRCRDLVGNYRKGVIKPYPAFPGCRCLLSKIYKFQEVEFKE